MKKKLYKNSENKMLAGVCSGIADYFDMDPTIMRIIWAVITLAGGSGLIAYIICALIMPDKPDGFTEVDYTEFNGNQE